MACTSSEVFTREARSGYEAKPHIKTMAARAAGAIVASCVLDHATRVLSVGPGLLEEHLSPHVKSITGVDPSLEMCERFKERLPGAECFAMELKGEDDAARVGGPFDLAVVHATMHHVNKPAVEPMLRGIFAALRPGGSIAISDLLLSEESALFHSNLTTVSFPGGFSLGTIRGMLESAGFTDVRAGQAWSVEREIEGRGAVEFPFLLATACRPKASAPPEA
eukprot:tig00000881_g5236.t1